LKPTSATTPDFVEDKAKNLQATDALKTEYRRVCDTWSKKALPDF
jgi:hypothetical protein